MTTNLSQEQIEKLLIGKWKCKSVTGVWAFEFKYNYEFEQTLVESINFLQEINVVLGGRVIKGRWKLNNHVLTYTFEQYVNSMYYKGLGSALIVGAGLLGGPITWATISMYLGIASFVSLAVDPFFMLLAGKSTPLRSGIIEINEETHKQEFSKEIVEFTKIK